MDTNAAQCKVGGNDCWSRHISPPAPPSISAPSPLSLPEALDFLDAVWRLARRGPLVQPSTFVDAAGLIADCSSPEEFESRLSDIADALDQIKVGASNLPEGKEQTKGALNRLQEAVTAMEGADLGVINNAVTVLQKVVRLRVTHQHSNAASERPGILRDLGIPDSGISLSDTLTRVRIRATNALLALRSEIRRAVDAGGHE